jgi:predicted ABC-type transport system involved in lysophospholipase L1 biosynthesis ATPase subunit
MLVATHDRMLLDRADRTLTLHGGALHEGKPDFLADA